ADLIGIAAVRNVVRVLGELVHVNDVDDRAQLVQVAQSTMSLPAGFQCPYKNEHADHERQGQGEGDRNRHLALDLLQRLDQLGEFVGRLFVKIGEKLVDIAGHHPGQIGE